MLINGVECDIAPSANLQGAYLQEANLQGANLGRANLQGANLQGADLQGANLGRANLQGANLQGANLLGANLGMANLQGADLLGADLQGANLGRADLLGAYLQGAKNIPALAAAQLFVPPQTGAFEAYKKLKNGVIVKLLIPADAARSSATTRKCRAEFAVVLEGAGTSQHDSKFVYIPGEVVRPDKWDPDRWNECSHGIHFFMTREEAEAY